MLEKVDVTQCAGPESKEAYSQNSLGLHISNTIYGGLSPDNIVAALSKIKRLFSWPDNWYSKG